MFALLVVAGDAAVPGEVDGPHSLRLPEHVLPHHLATGDHNLTWTARSKAYLDVLVELVRVAVDETLHFLIEIRILLHANHLSHYYETLQRF